MKTVTKEIERTVKETKTIYIANDGEEFYSKTECKNHEESALKKRLTDVLVKVEYKDGIDALVDDWKGSGTYYSLKFKNKQQIKDFISYCNLRLEGVACNYKTFDNEEEKKTYKEKISFFMKNSTQTYNTFFWNVEDGEKSPATTNLFQV